MTKIKNTMRELYEQVRAYDNLLDIPQSVKYSKHSWFPNFDNPLAA